MEDSLSQVCELANIILSCNVAEIEFSSGHVLDVYMAMTPMQRQRGLSFMNYIDTSGMLFCYNTPSYVPFSMKDMLVNLDIAWYDQAGSLIQMGGYFKGSSHPIVCSKPFSFVLETPVGLLPSGDFRLRPSG